MPDAVVIGAGPNGLVAANLLADEGWSVEVLEEHAWPGGAVRHNREVDADFVSDLFSSFYPLAAASPVLARLGLEDHGLCWSQAPRVLAHPLSDGRCAVLARGIDATADSLDAFHPGDGDAWRRLHEMWERLGPRHSGRPVHPLPSTARYGSSRRQDLATFKVDWACDGPVPWQAEAAAQAGTVHVADGMDELTRFAAQITMSQVPDRPFALFGQMTTADPSRSPQGTEAPPGRTRTSRRSSRQTRATRA